MTAFGDVFVFYFFFTMLLFHLCCNFSESVVKSWKRADIWRRFTKNISWKECHANQSGKNVKIKLYQSKRRRILSFHDTWQVRESFHSRSLIMNYDAATHFTNPPSFSFYSPHCQSDTIFAMISPKNCQICRF